LHTKKIPLLDSKGTPIYLLGISEDITLHKKIESEKLALVREQVAREEAEKNVQRLELLAEASTILNSSLDIKKTTEEFFKFLTTRIADYCQLLIETDNQETSVTLESQPTDRSIGKLFQKFNWKLIKDVDEALLTNTNEKAVLKQLKSLKLKSVISVPLQVRNHTLGNILVATTQNSNRIFNIGDLQLVESLAERAGLSFDNARLFSEAQKA